MQKRKDEDRLIRIAIPNKGRIASPVTDLMERSGLHLLDSGDRRLVSRTPDPCIEVLFVRPVDIPGYVAAGAADLGITGQDLVRERRADVEQLLELPFGRSDLVVAVPDESRFFEVADLAGTTVATEFPSISESFFGQQEVPVTIVRVAGACEAAPYLGIADAIVDLTSSGETLRSNRLRVLSTILESRSVLIANHISRTHKSGKIEEVILALESVIRARGQCYLMMNVHRADLDRVTRLIPGLSGPTIMDVASREDMVALHAVVEEECVYRLINLLRQAGAKDILVMSIERMVR